MECQVEGQWKARWKAMEGQWEARWKAEKGQWKARWKAEEGSGSLRVLTVARLPIEAARRVHEEVERDVVQAQVVIDRELRAHGTAIGRGGHA